MAVSSVETLAIGKKIEVAGLKIRNFADYLDSETRNQPGLNIFLPMIGYLGVALELGGRLILFLQHKN